MIVRSAVPENDCGNSCHLRPGRTFFAKGKSDEDRHHDTHRPCGKRPGRFPLGLRRRHPRETAGPTSREAQAICAAGRQIVIGSQDDADYLIQAAHDADAFFWATPPGYGSDNVPAYQNRLGKAGATAVRNNGISRVVVLSSVGANLAAGSGRSTACTTWKTSSARRPTT